MQQTGWGGTDARLVAGSYQCSCDWNDKKVPPVGGQGRKRSPPPAGAEQGTTPTTPTEMGGSPAGLRATAEV